MYQTENGKRELLILFREEDRLDGVVKTLHLLHHCKFTVTAAYVITHCSDKFTFLEYEVFYLAIEDFAFYELVRLVLLRKMAI
jgi:hypothetical protein